MLVRLQKFLAEAGLGSRRHCETLITAGQVSVNGQPATTLGTKIDPADDAVVVAGLPVRVERKVYIALHKPPGYLCTSRDTHDRPTVFDLLPECGSGLSAPTPARTGPSGRGAQAAPTLPRLHTVGRLDYDTAGLLFLTNDGTFSLRLTHPRYKMPKTYRAEVAGELTAAPIAQLLKGVRSEGEWLRAAEIFDVQPATATTQLQLVLREGKKRQVRRMLAAVGHPVRRLTRVAVGTITLGQLKPGQWRYLTNEEIRELSAV